MRGERVRGIRTLKICLGGIGLLIALPAHRAADGQEWTSAAAQTQERPALADASAPELPDRTNPEYVYCEDFEEGQARDGSLGPFSLAKRNGVREGAGYKSRFGYSNVLIENNGIPPYPVVRFPKQTGPIFVHYHLKAPPNFYLGRANHGYYVYDSEGDGRGKDGSVVKDHATDHPAWLDPEWDPHTINVLRGSGYHRMTRSFEGFEPKPRGQWHSHQIMIVPSQKDPTVGRIKVWIDGELANFCKHDTIPRYDTFWISNYWHSWEYVPKDTLSNMFEAYTAPPHPAFEMLLDNLIISKGFIEFGPNRFQIERVRFANLQPSSFTVHFDTTVPAKTIRAEWGEVGKPARKIEVEALAPRYSHSLRIDGLEAMHSYRLRLGAADEKGREVRSEYIAFAARSGVPYPYFELPDWAGEVFSNLNGEGVPAYIRNFRSLSYVAWPGPDSDDLVDTSKHMFVRYTKRLRASAGTYVFRVLAYDGVRVSVDGEAKVDAPGRTQGHNYQRDFALSLAEGEHAVVVEHRIQRHDDWERGTSKFLAFGIEPEDQTPPQLWAQAIYNTEFHKPQEALYASRWSEDCAVTIDFGPTEAYGQTLGDPKRFSARPSLRFPPLELGQVCHYRVTAVDLMGNKTVLPDATFKVGDTIPPRKILLSLSRASDTQLQLAFRAPGEDANHGTATEYDVRWSTDRLTIANWERATKVANLPKPNKAHTEESITLDGFPRGKTYYVAIRAVDNDGQAGLLSNIVSDPPGREVMDCDGDGYGVGSLLGPDPDDYDAAITGAIWAKRQILKSFLGDSQT